MTDYTTKGLFNWSHREIASFCRDEFIKHEYSKVYRLVTNQLRKTYKLSGTMFNFSAQMLVDEIAVVTIRIRDLQSFLFNSLHKNGELQDKYETVLRNLKKDRIKAMQALDKQCGGVDKQKSRSGKEGYRGKMNRSKKFQQARLIENFRGMNAEEAGQETGTQAKEQEKEETPGKAGNKTGLEYAAGGNIPLSTTVDSRHKTLQTVRKGPPGGNDDGDSD